MKNKLLIGGLALILFGCNSAHVTPQKTALIPRETLFGNPEKVSPRLSPDGTKIAYLAPDQNGVLNVWLQEQGKPARLVTSDEKRGIRRFFWEVGGQRILYIQDRGGDENWHLYRTDLETNETINLTPFPGAMATVIAYEAAYPNDLLVQINDRDKAFFDVYRINLADGSCTLEETNDQRAIEWVADHTLTVRALQACDEKGDTIVSVRDGKGAPWRELMRWGPGDEGRLVSFSPDNQSLYLFSNRDSNTEQLLELNLADGSQKLLVEDPNYDLSMVLQNPTSHELEAVNVIRDRPEWILLNPKIEPDFTQLHQKDKTISLVSRDLSDRYWIVAYSSDRMPSQYVFYDRVKKQQQFLFDSHPKLAQYRLAEMKPVSFAARDGMELHGYLTLPVDQTPKNLPTVLYVHGGPWSRDDLGYDAYAQWLANRGYAVIQVNFRGSSGYGKAYLNAGNREWGGKMHTDLLDAKQWLVAQGIADPNKVAIFGGSYGGYATLVGLAFTPEEFCCGVDVVGPSNLISLSKTIPPYWGPFKPIWSIRVGNDSEVEFLQSRSPLFKADQIVRPLLIAQGANDPRVNQAESDQIVEALRSKGQQVEYLLFPDEGHGFARPENRLTFCTAMERFLQQHLGGRAEP